MRLFLKIPASVSGIKIPKNILSFFTTKDEGTGLGLAIAYRIIEEHKGKINVISNPGEGTVFKVIIPDNNGKSSNSKILIVEDEKSMREVLGILLEGKVTMLLLPQAALME